METCRLESLCAPGPCEGPVPYLEVGLRHHRNLEVRSDTEGGGGGRVGLEIVRVGPPTPTVVLELDEVVVLVCGQPCAAVRLGHPQVDHGGAGGLLQMRATPRGEYPRIR